jgi:hypothetical protein
MSYDDPLTLDRQIRHLADFDDQYQLKLRIDPESADPSGPFIDVPEITRRGAFTQLRELPEDLPLRWPMLRWAYRLAEARVNAPIQLAMARNWRCESVTLEMPQRTTTTRASLLIKLLSDTAGRSQWLAALRAQAGAVTDDVSELWQRRDELAKRAGFAGVTSVIDPNPEMTVLLADWLARSASMSTDSVPKEPIELLEVALANRANRGWPGRIGVQSIAALLGERSWLKHATIREPNWPLLIGPTSFMRALHYTGQELARTWAATTHPFVIANEPWHLAEHRLGSLLSSLVLNAQWQRRVLGLQKDRAQAQVRDLSRCVLLASRALCLKLRLRLAAIQSTAQLRSAFVEQMLDIFGFELPGEIAGQIPRIAADDAQRLVGLWMGLSDHARLIQSYDEDWFRNPRAIEAVLGQLGDVGQLSPSSDSINIALSEAANWLGSVWS